MSSFPINEETNAAAKKMSLLFSWANPFSSQSELRKVPRTVLRQKELHKVITELESICFLNLDLK
jgi:hypothetical protein